MQISQHAWQIQGLKESLYTHARFLDLFDKFDGEMLVCNTKVSSDVITYSKCVGQQVLSWKHPTEKGLERMIEEKSCIQLPYWGQLKKNWSYFPKTV